MTKMLPYTLDYAQYSAVYNALSFVMASMGASTVYFFFHAHLVKPEFRTAICISALVTLIAFYHYFRIFRAGTLPTPLPQSPLTPPTISPPPPESPSTMPTVTWIGSLPSPFSSSRSCSS